MEAVLQGTQFDDTQVKTSIFMQVSTDANGLKAISMTRWTSGLSTASILALNGSALSGFRTNTL